MTKQGGFLVGVSMVMSMGWLALPREVGRYAFCGLVIASMVGYILYQRITAQQLIQIVQSIRHFCQHQRHWLCLALIGSSLLLFAQQAVLLGQWHHPLPLWLDWRLIGLAAGLVAASYCLAPLALPTPIPKAPSLRLVRWGLFLLSLIGLLMLAETSGRVWLFNTGIALHWQALGFAVCLVILGFAVAGDSLPRLSITQSEWGGLLLVTFLALGIRLWQLDSSIRMFVDEVLFIEGMKKLSYTPTDPLFNYISGNAPFSQFYTYGMLEIHKVLGPSFFSMRLLSAILGALTIPALYWLGRYLFNPTIGVIAALLLLSLPLHLHFSRLALNQVGDPLFGVLALALIARGIHTGQARDYWLGGIALGLTQYFYEGGRLVFPSLVAIWLGLGWLVWKPRLPWQALAWVFIPALMVAWPWYYTIYHTQDSLVAHYEKAGSAEGVRLERLTDPEQREGYLEHLELAMGSYVAYTDASFYYLGDHAMILPFLLPFFFIGLVVMVLQGRNPAFVPIIWIVGVGLGNSLIRQSNYYTRFLNSAPALALILAVGLYYVTKLLIRHPKYQAWGAIGAACAVMVGQGYYYFEVHLPYFNDHARFLPDSTDAMIRATDLPNQTIVYVVTDDLNKLYHEQILHYLAPEQQIPLTIIPTSELTGHYLRFLDPYLTHAFFIQSGDWRSQQLLAHYFVLEDGQYSPNADVPRDKSYIMYLAKPQFRP